MDAKPARLDPTGTAAPLTRIIDHRNPGHCFGPGMALKRPQYEGENGDRITLVPTGDEPLIVPSESGETKALFLTDEDSTFLRQVLAAHSLLHPHDKSHALALIRKLKGQ